MNKIDKNKTFHVTRQKCRTQQAEIANFNSHRHNLDNFNVSSRQNFRTRTSPKKENFLKVLATESY